MLLAAPVCIVSLSALTLSTVSVGRAGGGVALRQVGWFIVGLLALTVVASLDYRRVVRIGPAFYVLGLGGLLAGFVLGRTVSGPRRWIVLGGGVTVQPSEFFKVCFVLTAVWLLASRWAQPLTGAVLAAVLPLVAVPFILIIKQPDL